MDSSVPHQIRPLRRVEYDKLIELGAFQDERIELLEGAMVAMPPIGAPHSSAVQELNRILLPALLERATVRIQNPFAALDDSEPEPDVAVVPPGRYATAHPEQAYLIVEVSESSLPIDRVIKQRIYARSGVPEYWIVNLVEGCIEVYTEPGPIAYARVTRYGRGQTLRPIAFADVEVRVDDVISPD
jgi:Uma2 family endonuclease